MGQILRTTMTRRVPTSLPTTAQRLSALEVEVGQIKPWKRLVSRTLLRLGREVQDLASTQATNEAAALSRHAELMTAIASLRSIETETRGHWACPLRSNPELTSKLLGLDLGAAAVPSEEPSHVAI